ncbi:MAG: NAD-dependent epimerase/dehydratase family protein [Sphingomonas sp.]|uniref:NAD-dependent epimerase/dehydratase family protein n=1 Tax=Sphingomonas sp. TaxID=28214 RepID=UPI0025D49D49|nr:NAD-dependent epimerase/dehydratase family protein [Sphingomonas sp.]MBX9881489.1 NAD-dependent epimerase/dehydratase family protein [Sphingomonas sp.]
MNPGSRSILVSGANGFIAAHAVERLLARGDSVIGTVRNPDDPKHGFLRALPGAERLSLSPADLLDAQSFLAPASQADAVLHMASPYVMTVRDPQRDLVDPAVQGTLAVLEAAAKSPRVKRVVLTSSMAAVTDEPPTDRALTEGDWNTRSTLRRNPYYLSKTLAERAAWDFMAQAKPGFDLVVINPFLVVGPAHTAAINTSNQIFVDLLAGTYPVIMALDWGFVDVRDVADAHLLALDNDQASGRYLCAAANMNMAEVVRLVRAAGYRGKLPSLELTGAIGTSLMRLASYAQPQGVGSYLRSHLGRVPRVDTAKIRRELSMAFRPVEQSIRDTLADLARWGHIRGAEQAK